MVLNIQIIFVCRNLKDVDLNIKRNGTVWFFDVRDLYYDPLCCFPSLDSTLSFKANRLYRIIKTNVS
jgi:hypothetical protein